MQCRKPKLFVAKKEFCWFHQNKEGRKLDENIKSIAKKFFENDKHSRITPGSKDYVSAGKK